MTDSNSARRACASASADAMEPHDRSAAAVDVASMVTPPTKITHASPCARGTRRIPIIERERAPGQVMRHGEDRGERTVRRVRLAVNADLAEEHRLRADDLAVGDDGLTDFCRLRHGQIAASIRCSV
jgi:hypothetical protein